MCLIMKFIKNNVKDSELKCHKKAWSNYFSDAPDGSSKSLPLNFAKFLLSFNLPFSFSLSST